MPKDILKIGVSACIMHKDPERALFKGKDLIYAEESMLHWLMRHSAMPLIIPRHQGGPISAAHFVREVDGLLLQGGADVSPSCYGESAETPDWQGDLIRDHYELELIEAAFQQKKPILGICRGHQILNVAFGGSLFQDIEAQNPGSLKHRNWDIYDKNYHDLAIVEGSKLSALYENRTGALVNSVHHQAVKRLANGFVAEAHSPHDGIIEAIRYAKEDDARYMVGIQWHPEFQSHEETQLLPANPIMLEFLAACSAMA